MAQLRRLFVRLWGRIEGSDRAQSVKDSSLFQRSAWARLADPARWKKKILDVPRRGRVVVGLLVVVALLGMGDRYLSAGAGEREALDVAASASASSSAWYCPFTPSERAHADLGTVQILNPTKAELTGTISFFPSVGSSVDVPVAIAPATRVEFRPGEFVDAPFSAALVKVNGGGAIVEHGMPADQGVLATPCATSASPRWYSADGSTEADTTMLLALFNPFLEDAVADFRFVTNAGRAAPEDFQGVVVPARSLLIIDIGAHIRRRAWITTAIETRRGRLVVEQLQRGVVDNTATTTLNLLAPTTASTWYLAQLSSGKDQVADRLAIYNPGNQETKARLELTGDNGPLEPIELYIPGNGRIAFDLAAEDRVIRDASFSAALRSEDGEDLVVARTSAIHDPEAVTGAVLHPGSMAPAKRWGLSYGKTADPFDQLVQVFNPGDTKAEVKFSVLGEGSERPAGPPITIDPGDRFVLRVDDPALEAGEKPSLLVDSDQPVVVEREFRNNEGRTLSASLGVAMK